MSEVKRYYWNADNLDGLGYGSVDLLADASSQELVKGEDFDRVTAERDAALVRVAELESSFDELADSVGFSVGRLDQTGDSPIDCANQLQQRLTEADERADVLEGFLSNAYETAAKWVEKRCDAYVDEHGSRDPETGTVEFPGDGEEYVAELMEIADGLRALKPAEVPYAHSGEDDFGHREREQ